MDIRSLGRALKHRNYRLFIIGQSVSLIGTWMQQLAMSWLVLQLTGSAFWLGVVGFATQIPGLIVSPIGGVFTDRWNRHRALVITQGLAMLQAFALAILVWVNLVTVWQIIALGVVLGVVNAIDMPLRQAFLPQMIGNRDDLANAIAVNSSIVNGTRLIGPSLAGLLMATSGAAVCCLVNALSYIAVLTALMLMRELPQTKRHSDESVLRGLLDGAKYAFGFGPIRAILLLLSIVSAMSMSLSVLMPYFAEKVFHGNAATLGFLMGASGAGALMGALYLASRTTVLGLGRHLVWATTMFGLGLLAFSFCDRLALALPVLVVTGFCMMLQMAASNTLLQTIVDDDKRGRVMSFYATAFLGMAPLGSLLAGFLASHLGAQNSVRIAGGVCLCGALVFGVRLEQMREQIRPIYRRAGILPPLDEGVPMSGHVEAPPH
jgi:MFS family permease